MSSDVENSVNSTPEYSAVLSAQHNAFGVIFSMFQELKDSNAELEERVIEMGMAMAKDKLCIVELQEEVKVRKRRGVME